MIDEQHSLIVRTVSSMLAPFIQLFGLYVIIHGHTSPGGGFQGGVILGSSFILLSIAHGIGALRRRVPRGAFSLFTSLGVSLYAAIGVVCLLLGGNFLDYGVLPVAEPRNLGMLGIEIGVGLTVAGAMSWIFLELAAFE